MVKNHSWLFSKIERSQRKMKWILVFLLAFCFSYGFALRCATADGLSVEDVRKGENI